MFQPGFVNAVNEAGTVGGYVLIDPDNYLTQAALFDRDRITLIPPQPGEVTSSVVALNDSGDAVVVSSDASSNQHFVLYKNGQSTVLDLGANWITGINNQGIIAGTESEAGLFTDAHAFRFDPRTGKTTLLNPVSPDPIAWSSTEATGGINNRGDVVGWSFVATAPYHERVGVWDRTGQFTTYFYETANSNRLRFNDNNLIVITEVRSPASDASNSYLVPRPGVRLNVADLVDNL